MAEESFELDINPGQQLKNVLSIARQSWFTIFTFLALGLLVGVALFNFMPKEYDSETKIMLRSSYLFGGDPNKKEEVPLGTRAKLLKDQLKSTSWIEKVLDRLEWPEWAEVTSSTGRRAFITRLKDRLEVEIKRGETGESLVFIQFRYSDRWKARNFVKGIRDQWLSEVVETLRVDLDQEVAIREEQMHYKNQELESLWRELEAFERLKKVSMLQFNQDLLARKVALRGDLDVIEADIAELQAQEDVWESYLRERDEDGNLKIPVKIAQSTEIHNQELQTRLGSIEELTRMLVELKAKDYTEKHYLVISTRRRLEEALTQVGDYSTVLEFSEGEVDNTEYLKIQNTLQNLRVRLTGLRKRKTQMAGELVETEKILANQPGVERELQQRRQSIDTQQILVSSDYIALQPLKDRQRAISRMGGTQFLPYSSLEEPSVANEPRAGLGWFALGVSIVIGLSIGVALVAGRELLKTAITSAEQARRVLRIPVLGEVAPIQTELEARRARLQRNLQMAASLTLLVGLAATIYLCMAHSELLPLWLLERAAEWRQGLL